MTRRSRAVRSGLTLVEILVAVAVFAIVLTAVTAIWFSSDRAFQTGSAISEAQAVARRAMTTLETELRSAQRSSIVLDLDGDGVNDDGFIAFSSLLPDDTTPTDLRYYVDDDRQLVRDLGPGTTGRTVATDVDEFRIIPATGEAITVVLDISVRDREASLQTQVAVRNP